MKTFKVAVVTANIGGFDPIFGMCKQTREFDFHYFTESNLPFPLPNLNNRLKSKYIKICMHRFLPDYDVYIWVDGRIKIIADSFVANLLFELQGHDAVFYKHRERKTPYQELNYILDCFKHGNDYLINRYINQSLEKELDLFTKEQVPIDSQLYMTGVFARWNQPSANDKFDEWWKRCIEYSYFDQAMLSYIEQIHKLKIKGLDYDEIRTYKLFTIDKHIQNEQSNIS